MSLKKLCLAFFSALFLCLSFGQTAHAQGSCLYPCDVSFDPSTQRASVEFDQGCRLPGTYSLNVVGQNYNTLEVEYTYQAIPLNEGVTEVPIQPFPIEGRSPALMLYDSQGQYACGLYGTELQWEIQRARAQCSWQPMESPGDFRFCVAYPDNYSGQNTIASFYCANSGNINDCGGIIEQIRQSFGVNVPTMNLTPVQTGTGFLNCLELRGYNAEAVAGQAAWQTARSCGQEAAVVLGSTAATTLLPAGRLLRVVVGLDAIQSVTQRECVARALDAAPLYRGEVKTTGGESLCTADLRLSYQGALPQVVEEGEQLPDYDYCKQVPTDQQAACQACVGENPETSGRLYTAVGCIHVEGESLAADLIRLFLGLAGGIALLSILAGAFLFTTSQGESNRVKQGKELITAAIAGLFFIIFSVIILDFIGVKILQIPGLG